MNAASEKARKARIAETEASAPESRRAPTAFAMDEMQPARKQARIAEEPDFTQHDETPEIAPAASRSGTRWLSGLFWSAIMLLVSLYLVDAGWELIARLATKSPALGQIARVLAGIAVLVLTFYLVREFASFLRLRRIRHIRSAVEEARNSGRSQDAKRVLRLLHDFYAGDADTAAARHGLKRTEGDVLDARTRLDMAERALLAPKDEVARHLIAQTARRVSMVTALSPRAMIDVIFVLTQSVLMIRKLSTLYGGRAGGLGLWRLAARILAHLAVTGGVAMADSLAGQVLGAGLATRLSAKLGEGVLNGILSARVGIATLEYCRPMDFVACEPIILSEVVKSIVTLGKVEEKPAA